jgi:diguanylate cyclase (GGDEF)-like protein
MAVSNNDLLRLPAPVHASRWIVTTVAFCAIVLFALLGSEVVPAALRLESGRGSPIRGLTTPFLLTVALVLLAWRRSNELKKAASARAEAEARAYNFAYKDDVTGLFNRRFLVEKLKSSSAHQQHTLLLLDLDHFKKVNDLYGHAAGDSLLLELSERMQRIAPKDATCVRLGGDEFAILISGDGAQSADSTQTAERLLAGLSRPVQLEASIARIGASIGLATIEHGEPGAECLLRRSDIAMYEAKRRGRNCLVWFDAAMEEQLNERNRLEAEMREGISEGSFIPYFQPMLDLSSKQVTGFEVLARWNHPRRGIVEPDDFISVAEATGMISDLSFSVMRQALLRGVQWPNDITIAVNVSPVQFKDPLLAERIIKLLEEVGFPANRLELEITETAILADRDLALATVKSLKDHGVRISLDDFGTGYASLSQLRELPFDRIKIDKSFVASLLSDQQSNAIVHAIATLGKNLDLPITAEGVETEIVHQRLQELGCSDAQGWLFGRAICGREAGETFFRATGDNLPEREKEITLRPTQERRDYLRRGRA